MEPVSQDYVPCSWKGKKLATFLMLSPESQAQTLSDLDAQCLVFFFFKSSPESCTYPVWGQARNIDMCPD